MTLTCSFLLLFVLKVEKHLSQELEILYTTCSAYTQKVSEYILLFRSGPPPHPLPPPPPPTHKIQICFFFQKAFNREFKIRVVGFLL